MWGKKRHSFKKLLRGDWLQGAHTFYVCCYPEQISLYIILWLSTCVATEDGHYVVGLYNISPACYAPWEQRWRGWGPLAHRQFSHILHPRALSERYGGAAGKIRHHFYSRPFHNTSPVEGGYRGQMCPWLALAVSKPSVVEFPALEGWPFGPSHFSSLETLSDWMISYFPLKETLWCHNSTADLVPLGQMVVSETQCKAEGHLASLPTLYGLVRN